MAPREPNCARDWIICGRPIVGPWLAWNAMKNVPKPAPRMIARQVQPRDSPSEGPTKPDTIVTSTKLPVNQNGAWCHTFP
jgi:hypothetical protein